MSWRKNLEQAHNTIRIISKSAAMQEEVNTVEDLAHLVPISANEGRLQN